MLEGVLGFLIHTFSQLVAGPVDPGCIHKHDLGIFQGENAKLVLARRLRPGAELEAETNAMTSMASC